MNMGCRGVLQYAPTLQKGAIPKLVWGWIQSPSNKFEGATQREQGSE
jgi:hypothetical protein